MKLIREVLQIRFLFWLLLAALFFPRGFACGKGVELGDTYTATLDYSAEGIGREWTSGKQDVWSLGSFGYSVADKLEIQLGPSSVVFGRHGSNVVWAAVIPEKPGKLVKAPAGSGENVTSIFLRFHPKLVQTIFSPRTVLGNGPAEKLIPARRIYQYKINAGWQTGNLPVIPQEHSITLDCETAEGNRRRFHHDTGSGAVDHHAFFLKRRIPEAKSSPVGAKQAEEIFLEVWEAFDREYAMFVVKPNVNWARLRDEYLPIAKKARTYHELAGAVALLLSHLEDLHVSVKAGPEYLWCYNRYRPLNGSWRATQQLIGKTEPLGNGFAWGKTKDRIGYINVLRLPGREMAADFDRILDELKDTRALVLDLRFNGGGDEPAAQLMAGRFVDKRRVYSLSQYRSGSRHDQLGKKYPRTVAPRGPWRYEKPVIVLTGRRTMSSAESFALMMAQCPQVTTLGDRTAGSSGNPRLLKLPGEITVRLPRWLDMDPQGKPIDGVGVQPDVPLKTSVSDFTAARDPVVEAALKRLRGKRYDPSRTPPFAESRVLLDPAARLGRLNGLASVARGRGCRNWERSFSRYLLQGDDRDETWFLLGFGVAGRFVG